MLKKCNYILDAECSFLYGAPNCSQPKGNKTMKSSVKKVLVVACLALMPFVTVATRSFAQTPAYITTSPASENDQGGYGQSGFEFTPSENLDLTDLGFTALSLGGGDTPHVTLWNATAGLSSLSLMYDTGDILGSVTSTGQGTHSGVPSFVSVGAPILLTAGNTYLITAPAYWESTFPLGTIAIAPVYTSDQFLSDGGWTNWDPTNTVYNNASLVPANPSFTPTAANFEFTVPTPPPAAPEPSTYVLIGLGLAALVVIRRRRAALDTLHRQEALETLRQRVGAVTA